MVFKLFVVDYFPFSFYFLDDELCYQDYWWQSPLFYKHLPNKQSSSLTARNVLDFYLLCHPPVPHLPRFAILINTSILAIHLSYYVHGTC